MKAGLSYILPCDFIMVEHVKTQTPLTEGGQTKEKERDMKTTYFVLHLLLVPDITDHHIKMGRVYFHDHETCMYVAQSLHQVRDPIIGKANCVEVDNFIKEVRIPLPKPEFMK